MKWLLITGILIIILSIGMFCIGVAAFTSLGDISLFLAATGEFSFFFLAPTLIVGIIVVVIGVVRRK